jgi:predicted anti-sigma-YlaC factor YlaD
MTKMRGLFLTLTAVFGLSVAACSHQIAMNAVSNALTAEGSAGVFTEDPDPRLVGDALPFAIKMYESLLAANPRHQGLLRTTGSLLVMYANGFVQKPAEQLPRSMYAERRAAMERAKKLYLRGLDLLYRGMELRYRGSDGQLMLAKMKKSDVPSLYWAAAGGLSAFSLNPLDLDLGMRVPEFFAFAQRAYELDAGFNAGALDDLLLLFYASVPASMGGDKDKAEEHYRRALEKSGGRLAGPYVSYAQAVSIPAQDYDTFKVCLNAALAIDPDADKPNRLVNTITQRKARYLLDNAALYFINIGANDWDDEW